MTDEKRLLNLIAAVPSGDKLPLSRFSREMNAAVSVIASMIERLINSGALDQATLRVPLEQGGGSMPSADRLVGATGAQLFALIEVERGNRGLSQTQVSRAIFGNDSQMPGLAGCRVRPAQAKTIAKVAGWLKNDIETTPVVQTPAIEAPAVPAGANEAGAAARRCAAPADRPQMMKVEWTIGDRPSGDELEKMLRRAAEVAGETLTDYVAPICGQMRGLTWLAQLSLVACPKPATVARVRALIEGRALPPVHNACATGTYPRNHPSAGVARDRVAAGRDESEQAAALRQPGETLAAAVAREASEAGDNRRIARKLGNVSESPVESPADRLRRLSAEMDGDDAGEITATRRMAEDRDLATSSALIRRAKAEWPGKCAAVAGLAVEMGLSLGEAWQRVIDAGVECLVDEGAR